MSHYNRGDLRISGATVNLTVGAASTFIAIPDDSDGRRARRVRIFAEGDGDQFFQTGAEEDPGDPDVVATVAGSTPIAPGGEGLVLNVIGETQIAAIRSGGSDGTLWITPLGD